jgi:hypothetical protein
MFIILDGHNASICSLAKYKEITLTKFVRNKDNSND